MKKYFVIATMLSVFAVPFAAVSSVADDGKFKKRYENRQEHHQKWQNASDEQKEKVIERRKERIENRHEKWEDMSDEEREEAKRRYKERRDKARGIYKNSDKARKAKAKDMRQNMYNERQEYRDKNRRYWKNLND